MKKFNEFVAEATWSPNLKDPEVIVYDNGMTNNMIMAGMMNVSSAMNLSSSRGSSATSQEYRSYKIV